MLDNETPNVTDPMFGVRTGRYEDGVLIVETGEFPAMSAGLASGWDPNGNGVDIPSSEQKRLVERYTVNEDGSQLVLEYTVTDPAYLSEPFSDRIVWHRMPPDSPIRSRPRASRSRSRAGGWPPTPFSGAKVTASACARTTNAGCRRRS